MAATDKFESAQARIWKAHVDTELDSVESLLREVAEVTSTVPGGDDTIMKAIEAIGTNEQIIWNDVVTTFSDLSEKTQSIINAFEQYGEEAIEKINALISKRS